MSESSKDSVQRLHEFFATKPDAEEKAWGLIYEFYHHVLTYMEKKNITRADLAKKLGKSRAAITQMFNKNPNISVLKMVEIADAVGIDLVITTREQIQNIKDETKVSKVDKPTVVSSGQYIIKPAPSTAAVFPSTVRDRQISYPVPETEKDTEK